jgi:hypothetical protein
VSSSTGLLVQKSHVDRLTIQEIRSVLPRAYELTAAAAGIGCPLKRLVLTTSPDRCGLAESMEGSGSDLLDQQTLHDSLRSMDWLMDYPIGERTLGGTTYARRQGGSCHSRRLTQ